MHAHSIQVLHTFSYKTKNSLKKISTISTPEEESYKRSANLGRCVCKFFWFSFFCFFSWVHVTACIVCLFWVWDQKTLLEAEVEKASCFGCEIKREKLACLGRGVKDCKQAGMEKASYFWVWDQKICKLIWRKRAFLFWVCRDQRICKLIGGFKFVVLVLRWKGLTSWYGEPTAHLPSWVTKNTTSSSLACFTAASSGVNFSSSLQDLTPILVCVCVSLSLSFSLSLSVIPLSFKEEFWKENNFLQQEQEQEQA